MARFSVHNHSSYFDLGDKIIGYTPKSATTSIHRSLRTLAKPKISQQMVVKRRETVPVIVFVRHPLDRLVSAHAFFTRADRVNPGIPENFSDFVDFLLKKVRNRQDEHWIPQTDYHTYHKQYLPTVHYPLEHINEIWPTISRSKLERLNANKDRPEWEPLFDSLSNEQQAGLLAYYADDIRVYEKALAEWRNWHTQQS